MRVGKLTLVMIGIFLGAGIFSQVYASCGPFNYENNNQVDSRPSIIFKIQGRINNPENESLELLCVGIFAERRKLPVKFTTVDEKGRFVVDNLPPGIYRVLIKHEYGLACTANIRVHIQRSAKKSTNIVVYLLGRGEGGMHACSYGEIETK